MKIEWDESIGMGVPQLDEEHKKLIQILNRIEGHQHDNVDSETISLVMEQIREFASHHFHHEEEYMTRINYPGYTAHKQQHKQFKEKTASLCIDVMNHKENTPADIYRYLSEWVINHTLRADKQIQAFLEAQQACSKRV